MTEISKMFENAGVNKSCHANIKFDDCIYSPSDCGYYNYPDFTAEKQIKLIKWLSETRLIDIYFLLEKWTIEGMGRYSVQYGAFANALSGYINHIWQSLIDQEKEEIRGILNE